MMVPTVPAPVVNSIVIDDSDMEVVVFVALLLQAASSLILLASMPR
jgi:hypothetical protein